MPELPEVETVRRGLAARLSGEVIHSVRVGRRNLRHPLPSGLRAQLKGVQIEGFRRRGKYLLMRLRGGQSLLLHLGMSGRIVIGGQAERHEHLVIETASGLRVAFVDPRRFGLIALLPTATEATHPLLRGLGPEPLEKDFTPAKLEAALVGRRTSIKAALLDQRIVAGLGNIYVSEALFRARIDPRRQAGGLSRARVARLVAAIRETLAEALAAGGSSLRDYVQPSGELGYFQHAWKVYDRANAPCPFCPGPPACRGIRRIVQGGRASFYCPRRQR